MTEETAAAPAAEPAPPEEAAAPAAPATPAIGDVVTAGGRSGRAFGLRERDGRREAVFGPDAPWLPLD